MPIVFVLAIVLAIVFVTILLWESSPDEPDDPVKAFVKSGGMPKVGSNRTNTIQSLADAETFMRHQGVKVAAVEHNVTSLAQGLQKLAEDVILIAQAQGREGKDANVLLAEQVRELQHRLEFIEGKLGV